MWNCFRQEMFKENEKELKLVYERNDRSDGNDSNEMVLKLKKGFIIEKIDKSNEEIVFKQVKQQQMKTSK